MTLVCLALSGVLLPLLPLAAWVVAIALLVTKDRWVGVENLVALLVPVGFGLPWPAGLLTMRTGIDAITPLGIVALVAPAVAIWGVVWLVRRLRRRLRTQAVPAIGATA